jgi:hypothetical protein
MAWLHAISSGLGCAEVSTPHLTGLAESESGSASLTTLHFFAHCYICFPVTAQGLALLLHREKTPKDIPGVSYKFSKARGSARKGKGKRKRKPAGGRQRGEWARNGGSLCRRSLLYFAGSGMSHDTAFGRHGLDGWCVDRWLFQLV